MSARKKLITTLAVMCAVLVAVVATIVVVLVSDLQTSTSAINVGYEATDVMVDVSAKVYVGDQIYTFKTEGGDSTLSLTPDYRTGSLQQQEELINLSYNPPAVIVYSFINKDNNVGVKISLPTKPTTDSSITLKYIQVENFVDVASLNLESAVETYPTNGYTLNAKTDEYATTNICVVVSVADIISEGTLEGDFVWSLTRA